MEFGALEVAVELVFGLTPALSPALAPCFFFLILVAGLPFDDALPVLVIVEGVVDRGGRAFIFLASKSWEVLRPTPPPLPPFSFSSLCCLD